MNKFRLTALALSGALTLTLLAACSGGGKPAPAPETTPPAVTEPAETPEGGAGDETPAPGGDTTPTLPGESLTPEETQPAVTPSEKPQPEPTPAPSAKPTPTPAPADPEPEESAPVVSDPTLIQSIWTAISELDMPASLMDLDADTLSALYGIDSADLKEYVCKMPMMNVQATEFFLARVKDGKLDAVKTAVEQRQADLEAQWASYLPEQLELVQNYKLVTNGNYILFAVSAEADAAVGIFNSYTK